jgi:ureidoacrylate peracid hydrolase
MKQDHSTISVPELLRQTRCALLMIDTENRFFLENENGPPLPAAALLPCLQRLLQAARYGSILSVFVAVKHKAGTDSGPWLRRLALLRKGLPRMSRQYTMWGEGFPISLQPLESEVVVEKMRMSGLFGTCLESYLRNHGIETLVMAGVASNGAVLATALEALSRDLFTIVVRDATIGTTEDLPAASLNIIGAENLVDTASVCDIWQKREKEE